LDLDSFIVVVRMRRSETARLQNLSFNLKFNFKGGGQQCPAHATSR